MAGDPADATNPGDAPTSPDAPNAPETTPDGPSEAEASTSDGSPDGNISDAGSEGGDGGDGGDAAEAGLPSEAGSDADAGDAGPPVISWPLLTKYLNSLYDGSEKLVQRTPGSAVFFASPDNALAQRAFLYLPGQDGGTSAAINERLASLKVCGCSDAPGHNGLVNHQFDPLVHKGWSIPYTPGGPLQARVTDTIQSGGCTTGADASGGPFCSVQVQTEDRPAVAAPDGGSPSWSDMCTSQAGYTLGNFNATGSGTGYGDLIALELINYQNHGLFTDTLWGIMVSKWDGVGIVDAVNATDTNGFYSTYKLALFRLAARALKKPIPAGVDAVLNASQGANGGIRTNYSAGAVFDHDQLGSARDTSLVVLAFLLPDSELTCPCP